MSAAQAALVGLAAALATAAEPVPVDVGAAAAETPAAPPADGADAGTRIAVRPLALGRLGRSTRDGVVLDLELAALVTVVGPGALEAAERLLVGLERDGRYVVEPAARQDVPAGGLAFGVRVRVPVPLPQVSGPPVLEPLRLDVRTARLLAGVVVDGEGAGVPDAVVRARAGGRAVVADAAGRFRLLAGDGDEQDFLVEVRGTTRTLQAATSAAPVVIRWE